LVPDHRAAAPVYRFEDGGGILPTHEVGLQASGFLGPGPSRLEYSLSVSNGRGAVPAAIQTSGDRDGLNATNLWLGYRPGRLRSLIFGGVARKDRIPAVSQLPGREAPLDERILGAFAVFRTARTEAMAEYLQVRHEGARGDRYATQGMYLQLSRALGHWRPY